MKIAIVLVVVLMIVASGAFFAGFATANKSYEIETMKNQMHSEHSMIMDKMNSMDEKLDNVNEKLNGIDVKIDRMFNRMFPKTAFENDMNGGR